MALQSDSKEMGKVKLHMLIGDSDSQFSKHTQECPMPKNGQGPTKESGRCLILQNEWKNQKSYTRDDNEIEILNEEKPV